MIRALLVALVVLVAILAFVLDRPWLYAVSGASLVAALGWFVVQGWNTYRRRKRGASNASSNREHRLQDFGIVSIRPQEKESASASPIQTDGSSTTDQASNPLTARGSSYGTSSGTTDDSPSSPETTASTATRHDDNGYSSESDARGDTGGDTGGDASETPPAVSARNRQEASTTASDGADEQDSTPLPDAEQAYDSTLGLTTSARHEEPVLVPLVESLRAAVNASQCVPAGARGCRAGISDPCYRQPEWFGSAFWCLCHQRPAADGLHVASTDQRTSY